MDLVQGAFLTAVVFAVFLMVVVVIVMIINKEPVKKIDAELEVRLRVLQERQIMETLERRAATEALNEKILSVGLALKEIAKHTTIKSDDVLADVLIDIATPGAPAEDAG